MDSYQEETYQQDEYAYDYEPEPKKGMSGWLIALIVVLVLIVACCICACAALLLAGPEIGNVFSTIIETMEAPMP